MKLTPRRLALAVAFVFLLVNVRPLVSANPSRSCKTPVLFEAFKSKTTVETNSGGGAGAFLAFVQGNQRNECIDAARSKIGSTATRLAFFAVLGLGVALILGWRPTRKTEPDTTPTVDARASRE